MDIRIFLIGANLDPDIKIETADKDGYWSLQKLLEQYDKDVNKANSFSSIHNVSDERELLCAFFKFFRDNGEANIGMTIDKFVDAFLAHNNR